MSQIFHRSANSLARMSLVFVLIALGGGLWLLLTLGRSAWVTNAMVPVVQPVQFSHQHHVQTIGIDCRYCHTAVETSSFAGTPPMKTCMNCHLQIWSNSPYLEPVRAAYRDSRPLRWIRVHNLPDFVYFNHAVHIKKGIGCETCHGRVDKMPLMWQQNSLQMEWCLECHRNPEKYVRPRTEIYTMGYRPAEAQETLGPKLVNQYAIASRTDCSVCHR